RDNLAGFRSPPWPSTPRPCAERRLWKSSWPLLLGRHFVPQQRLARPHMRELDGRIGDLETAGSLPHDREARSGQIARLGKIRAVVRAARILALARGERNHPADLS